MGDSVELVGEGREEFAVSVGEFKGSLEALLDMLRARKMRPSEVSLASVADEYITYVRGLGDMPATEQMRFVVIIATLLLIKSRALLPGLELSDDEQEDVRELQARLELYKEYSYAAELLTGHMRGAPMRTDKSLRAERAHLVPTDGVITREMLAEAAEALLTHLPEPEHHERAEIHETVHIGEVIDAIVERVRAGMQTSFSTMTEGAQSKVDVIVHFLAMLELVKDGILRAEQQHIHGDIVIKTP